MFGPNKSFGGGSAIVSAGIVDGTIVNADIASAAAIAVAKLADGATVGQALLAGGPSGDPAFGALNLAGTSVVTGTLGVASGGTGAATFTANRILKGNTTSALAEGSLTDSGSGVLAGIASTAISLTAGAPVSGAGKSATIAGSAAVTSGAGGGVVLQGGAGAGGGAAGGIAANGTITAADQAGTGAGTITTAANLDLFLSPNGTGFVTLPTDKGIIFQTATPATEGTFAVGRCDTSWGANVTPTMRWGWNWLPGNYSARPLATQSRLTWDMEMNWSNDGGVTILDENNLDWTDATGLISRRPFAFSVNRATGAGALGLNASTIAFGTDAQVAVNTHIARGFANVVIADLNNVRNVTLNVLTGAAGDRTFYLGSASTADGSSVAMITSGALEAASGANLTSLTGANVSGNIPGNAANVTGIVAAANGGTGVNNVGTITNATATTITGGGTLGLGGYTLTVPATGTAALLATANVFTADQTVPTLQLAKTAVRSTLTLTPSVTAGDHTADGSYITFKVGSTAGMTATTTVVVAAGWTHADYNGTYRVYDVVDATHFRVAKATAEACSVVGTITHAPRVEDAGGVAHFAQDAAPTGPLTNDRWYETDSNVEWFWNGTYWLSLQEYELPCIPGTVNTSSLGATAGNFVACGVYNAYLTRMSGTAWTVNGCTAGNYYVCALQSQPGGATLASFNTIADADAQVFYRHDAAVNSLVDLTDTNNRALWWNIGIAAGAPGNSYISAVVAYRLAHR